MKVSINNQELDENIIYKADFFKNNEPSIKSSKIDKKYLICFSI